MRRLNLGGGAALARPAARRGSPPRLHVVRGRRGPRRRRGHGGRHARRPAPRLPPRRAETVHGLLLALRGPGPATGASGQRGDVLQEQRVDDRDRPIRPPSRPHARPAGHRAEHGQAVIAAGLERPPRRLPPPVTTKPSSVASISAPEAAQPLDHGGDAVGLLEAQLRRAADHGLALGEAAEQRDERQLVDRQRDLLAADRRSRTRRARSAERTGSGVLADLRGRILRGRRSRSPIPLRPCAPGCAAARFGSG